MWLWTCPGLCSPQREVLGWRLLSPQSGPLSRMGHSCVLQCTAASSLQPTFSSWTPSACLISPANSTPQVQLLCPAYRFPNNCRADSLTDTDIRKLTYSYGRSHVVFYMSYLYADFRVEMTQWIMQYFYIIVELEGYCAVDVSNLSWWRKLSLTQAGCGSWLNAGLLCPYPACHSSA